MPTIVDDRSSPGQESSKDAGREVDPISDEEAKQRAAEPVTRTVEVTLPSAVECSAHLYRSGETWRASVHGGAQHLGDVDAGAVLGVDVDAMMARLVLAARGER